jgi:methionyl-tRNA formyltransferase
MRIVFFGTPAFAADFLKGLFADSAFEVVGVITQPDEPVGRKKILTAPPVKQLAEEYRVPVFQPTKLKDSAFQDTIKNLGADVGVVVAYGRLLPDALMNVFPLGCVNVHPSLLPRYRGPSPITAAIVNGDEQTAVSIMKLVQEMDAGPLLAQAKLNVSNDETPETLTQKIVEVGSPLLVQTLKNYGTGRLAATEQDHSQATFCKLLSRQDGVIDWSEAADVIERKVRAYNPWPGTSSNDLKIFRVAISNKTLEPGQQLVDATRLYIGTSTQALEILELQPAGGKRMKTADYLRGRKA